MDTGQQQMLGHSGQHKQTNPHTNTQFFPWMSPGLRTKPLGNLLCNSSYSGYIKVKKKRKKKNQIKMKMSYVFFSLIHRINTTDAGCQALFSAVSPAFGVYCGFWLRGLTSQCADLEILKEVVRLAAGE